MSSGFENGKVHAISQRFASALELAEHRHRRHQFLHAASGVMAVSTPNGAWVVPPERAIWIPAGTTHSVRMIGVVQTLSVLVEPASFSDPARLCHVVSVSPLLRQLIVAASELASTSREAARDSLVRQLLLCEIERAPRMQLAVPFRSHRALAKRCQAFLAAPKAAVTIDKWADALAMNRRSFTRLFRRETGMSFTEWRQQACVSVALTKLATGESVTEVALGLGYDSPGNFSAVFKKVMGAAPSRYRLTV